MKIALATVALILSVFSVVAQTSISWEKAPPEYISSDGSYVAHVKYQTQVSGSVSCNVRDLNDAEQGSGSLAIPAGASIASVKLSTTPLTVGDVYIVTCGLLNDNGDILDSFTRRLDCVAESVRLMNVTGDIPSQSPYQVHFRYTATTPRYFVIILKNPADTVYLASADRVVLPAGVDVDATVPLIYRRGTLPVGQEGILRVDIREDEPLSAKYRMDRDETTVTVVDVSDGSDGNGVATIEFTESFSEIEDCDKNFTVTVNYTSNVEPNLVLLRIRKGRNLARKRVFGVPAGSGSVDFSLPTPFNDLIVGETYSIVTDIRPEALRISSGVMAKQRRRAIAVECPVHP